MDASEELERLPTVITDLIHERVSERVKERSLGDSLFRKFDAMFNRNKTREWYMSDNVDALFAAAESEVRLAFVFGNRLFSVNTVSYRF